MEHFFAPCPRGLEAVLAEELGHMGAQELRATEGGVAFVGPLELSYRANLHSRIASRILWQVAQAPYENEKDLYEIAHRLTWPVWFAVERTIRVHVTGIDSPLKSLSFAALKIKDAVCDRFREKLNRRPNVDTSRPDIRIHAFLTRDRCTLYLDSSGEALFKRGYRNAAGAAPLRENLAAGILRLTGWNAAEPLFDPLCGSGTFLLEAAMLALRRAPGRERQFAFRHFNWFDRERWAHLKQEAVQAERSNMELAIYGSDIDPVAIKNTRANLQTLGLEQYVHLQQADLLQVTPPAEHGIMVSNPPYGVRQSEQQQLVRWYPRLGDALKKHFPGWIVYLLSGDTNLPKLIGLKASRRIPLFNGPLECRLYRYELIAGSMRRS